MKLTEAVPTAFAADFATRFMIGATFVGPYNSTEFMQFWYAATTPVISANDTIHNVIMRIQTV